jgi:N-acetylneuraminic acid mutarotase
MSTSHAADWEKLPPLPEPSGGFICAAFGDEIVIAGGTTWRDGVKHWLDTIHAFDVQKKSWRAAGRLPAPLAYPVSGAGTEGLYFAGGSNGEQTHSALAVLTPKLTTRVIAPLEPRFVYAAAAVLGGELYVVGGAPDQAAVETATNACYAIELASGKTRRLPDLPVAGFITGTAAAGGGRIFVFAGAHWNAAAAEVRNHASAFAYAPAQNRWEPVADYPAANRGLTALALDDEHILIAGGYKNEAEEFTKEAFIFHTGRGEYRPTTPLPYRAMVALLKTGEYVYCLGGEDKKKHRADGCFRIAVKELLR